MTSNQPHGLPHHFSNKTFYIFRSNLQGYAAVLNWCQLNHVIQGATVTMDLTNKRTYELHNLLHHSDHVVMATSITTFL